MGKTSVVLELPRSQGGRINGIIESCGRVAKHHEAKKEAKEEAKEQAAAEQQKKT